MKYPNKKQAAVLSVMICFGIVGFSVWISAQGKNIDRIVVENKTRSLTVESIKPVAETEEVSVFEITFKNNYDKPISIYRFRVADELTDKDSISGVERDGSASGWILKPKEVSKTRFSAARAGKILLTIAAVLFEDGTGDGEGFDLTRLQENRAGVWMAFDKIIPILKEATKTNRTFTASQIELLEKEIVQLNEKDIPDNLKGGFVFARNYVGHELKGIREKIGLDKGFNSASEMADKFNQFETTFAKLSVNLPASISKEGRQ